MASDEPFFVRFWGVRGSIPCPGRDSARYGGNTACVEVRCGGNLLILDAGSGLYPLDRALARTGPFDAQVLLSHTHLDHICGWPFFANLLRPDVSVTAWAGHLAGGHAIEDVLNGLMREPFTPVHVGRVRARLSYRQFGPGETLTPYPAVVVRTAALNHPQGATGFRIEYGGRSVCYLTDTEHVPGVPDETVLALIEGADIVIYDATYSDDEFAARVHWGHSTWQEGVRLCEAAGARTLVAFHHDPDHDDAAMDCIAAELARARPGAVVAHEGLTLAP